MTVVYPPYIFFFCFTSFSCQTSIAFAIGAVHPRVVNSIIAIAGNECCLATESANIVRICSLADCKCCIHAQRLFIGTILSIRHELAKTLIYSITGISRHLLFERSLTIDRTAESQIFVLKECSPLKFEYKICT